MPSILHLGVGNFFRAHQAWYTQMCPDWRITGVSFRSGAIRDQLSKQDYTYSLVIKDAKGTKIKRITCIEDILVLKENPDAVIRAISDPSVALVTLTVTEKAYCLSPDGSLDLDHPAVIDDLNEGALTPVGALARGLAMRQCPVTVLCCDNLPENGKKLKAAVATFAHAKGLQLTTKVTFPSSMVDRITPATTDDIRAQAQDSMAVPTEAFTEWVVEDAFAADHPDWPGVQWVKDVAPHEMRKLRMLNGAHSYLAYAGILRGYTFVHEAIADPDLRKGAFGIMQEAAETLPESVQAQAESYASALITRFENPNLNHRLRQIAMDGSQKLPIRILGTLADRQSKQSPYLEAAISAWLAFVQEDVTHGNAVDDPLSKRIATACLSDEPEKKLRSIIGAG